MGQTTNIEELVSKHDAYAIIDELINDELINDEALLDSFQGKLDENWDSLETTFRKEDRSQLPNLGTSTTNRLLSSVSDIQYDKDMVSAFLNSNAVNSVFAMVLYDGISEFTTH